MTEKPGDAELIVGGGLGALAVCEVAVGALCPLCVLAAPVLLAVGAYKRLRGKRAASKAAELPKA
jgi:hypothetical protein